MEKDPRIYIRHILEAIANIEADTAANELKEQETHIPWRAIAGIGNVLRHDYHDTYPTVLWDTCNKDLTPLKDAVLRIAGKIEA